ncbi:MAG: ABC transporter ATP-binding protein [Acidobacteriota bacterium]
MIREMLRRYRRRYIAGVLLLLVTNGCGLAIPLLLRDAVEALRGRREAPSVATCALLIVALASMQALVRAGSRLAVLGASRRIAYDLRNRFFAHLQRLPATFFGQVTPGDLMSRAVNDMMSVRSFFGPGIMNLANTFIVYVASLSVMTWISPRLTLAALLPMPLLVLSVQRVSRHLHTRSRASQERLAALSDHAQENLTAIQMVKTYAQEESECAQFARLSADLRSANLALARVRGTLIPLMGSLGGAGSLVAVWVGGQMVARGLISLGEFVAFSAYLGFLVWPTVAMGWVINTYQRGRVAMRRLEEILSHPAEDEGARPDAGITAVEGSIELRHLTVAHAGGGAPALHDVSLKIDAGETVALVGPVGSGKTTIASILTRFLPVPDGTVFIDGKDINRIPLDVLRPAIGYAPQEAFLFSRTLGENIAFGLDTPRADAVEAAARMAGLSRDLEAFPDGLDTRVGEGGLTLSGGQRQRAALARALILRPRILILDDSLSSVDAETEQTVLSGVFSAARAATSILISHRLAAVQRADRIFVLDAGRLVETGTHESLLARDGLYARMFRRQTRSRLLQEEA